MAHMYKATLPETSIIRRGLARPSNWFLTNCDFRTVRRAPPTDSVSRRSGMREVVIAGVGMSRFGRYDDKTYIDHGVEAVQAALSDAGLTWPESQKAYCGACGIAG